MSDATDSASKGGQPPSEEACPQPDQPKDPAHDTQPVAEDLEAAFQSAQAAAIAQGKIFAVSEGDYHDKLAKLAPALSDVRKNIHQRQKGYKKGRRNGAPNWGKWLKFWRAETGVRLCDKTIKKVLDEIDEIKPAPREKKPRVKTITPAAARQMGLALLAMHEALSNQNEQGNVFLKPEDIAPILEIAPSPEQLNRLLESLRQEAEDAEPSQVAPAADSGSGEIADSSSVNSSPEQSPQPELTTGDAAGLTAAVIQKCAPYFEAVLKDLPPSNYSETIRQVAKEIAKQFRGPGVGGFSVKVSHIPLKRVASPKPKPAEDNRQQSLFEMSAPNSQAELEKIAS